MAQLGWVYLDPQGGRHRVGLYHGDKTGHLLIHCNLKVIQVDFAVKESKTYSFFIEDELCELAVYKENGEFSYSFTTNKKVDTPLNRQRKALNRKNLKYVLWSVAGLVLVIAGVAYGLHRFDKWQDEQRFTENSLLSADALTSQGKLASQGQHAVAQLFFQQEGRKRKVYYGFVTADSVRTTGQFEVPADGPFLLPTGFPLADQDAFRVTYLPANPRVHSVEFNVPTRATVTRYLQLAQTIEQQNHPQDTPEHVACIVLTVAEKNNWPALAHFIFQDKKPEENPRYNHDTYLKVLREPAMEALLKKECL